MFGEDLGRRSVSEAFSRLFVEVTRHRVEQALWHDREIGVAGQEAADAPVGVLDGTFLPGCAWIAEPASGTDPDFQSSEAGNSVPRSKVKLCRAKDGNGEKVAMIRSMIGRECRLWFLSMTV